MEKDTSLEIMRRQVIGSLERYGDCRELRMELENLAMYYEDYLESWDMGAVEGFSDGKITEKAAEMLHVTVKLFEKMEEDAGQDAVKLLQELLKQEGSSSFLGIELTEKVKPEELYDRLCGCFEEDETEPERL